MLPGGYKRAMEDKRRRDEFGELFEDTFTENESTPSGEAREDAQEDVQLDADVDSQDDDRAMRENVFGVNDPKPKT